MRSTAFVALVSVLILPATELLAATSAYWSLEEGPAGSIVPDGFDTVTDVSGNGNHMRTFSASADPFTSPTYVNSVSPLALRSGAPNTLALDFGPSPVMGTEDGNGKNDDVYSDAKPIHTQLFTAMTVELAFNMHSVGVGQYQALFGKDGKPLGDEEGEPDSPVPPLKIMVRGDTFPPDDPPGPLAQLFVEWIDGDGDIHFLAGGESVVPDQWYHVAFTLSATDAELWVAKESGDYTLVDAISGEDFAGPSSEVGIFEPLGYTIGRGMFNNFVTDWSDAIIDEVRISDAALVPSEFLFLPNPATDDANFDGNEVVDGNDLLLWQRNFGASGAGDANGDNVVDADDLAIWKAQYGGPGGGAVGAVPEPATIAVSAIGWISLALASRRRRTAA